MPVDQRPVFDLSQNWSPLTRNVLIGLVAVYIAQLVAPALFQPLAWLPLGGGFRPWQPLTSFLIQGEPFQAFFGWMAIFFFLTPVARDLGMRTFGRATLLIWAAASLLTIGVAATGVISGVHYGIAPFIAMLVAFFGFRNPTAQVYFYILPLRAVWLAWADGFLAFLFLLSAPGPSTLLSLLFWMGAFAWVWWGDGGVRRAKLRWKRREAERKVSKFKVIEGGRTGNDWVN